MQLIHHWQSCHLPTSSVFSIGNFDGVHLGHQAILSEVVLCAKEQGFVSGVIIFEPQPLEFFQGVRAPARLSDFKEKIRLLARSGLDYVVCCRFDATFAAMPASEFVETLLLKALQVKTLIVGEDFRFGAKREGDLALLSRYAQQLKVVQQKAVCQHASRVSSSQIRMALARGELDLAAGMLGRPYALQGRVLHGDKRARTIGVPTANIRLTHRVLPVRGVFCVEVLFQGQRYPAIANIGYRPTVSGSSPLLEVHLFHDQSLNLYGECLRVFLVKKLRDEKRFDTFELLQQQIKADVYEARAYWQLT